MNIDQDYDEEGNNIVPCPICLDNYCPSKDGGECPREDEFAERDLNTHKAVVEVLEGMKLPQKPELNDELNASREQNNITLTDAIQKMDELFL